MSTTFSHIQFGDGLVVTDLGSGTIRVDGGGQGAPGAPGGGAELDYAQITAPPANVTASTEATATALVTGNPVTYDGVTRVKLEAFIPGFSAASVYFWTGVFFDGATPIGQAGGKLVAGANNIAWYGVMFYTPAAGSHTFSFRVFVQSGQSIQFLAGPGGAGNLAPTFLRVTQAQSAPVTTGPGVPAGGQAGALLAKNSGSDYDTLWAPPAMALIADSGELASAQASISFSSIPQTYKALRLMLVARGDSAGAQNISVWLRFNGDSGANYDHAHQTVQGTASGAGSDLTSIAIAAAQIVFGSQTWPGPSGPAAAAGVGELYIPSYAATVFHKQVTFETSGAINTTLAIVAEQGGGHWRSAAAITSLTLLPSAGNFLAGSRAILYGVN